MSDFHCQKIDSCLAELKTDVGGLTGAEAKKRQSEYGLNAIEKEKSLSSLMILLSQFKSPLIYILIIAGITSLVLHEYVDSFIIFGAVFINTIIGFFQENKANNALSKLKSMIEHKAIVIREGHELTIDSNLVTIGDVIVLKAGNRVPADGRIISVVDLQVNESSLTGESVPSTKSNREIKAGASLADKENMVFAGTTIVRGAGRAVVTGIGGDTEIGKIASLVKGTKEDETPLQKRLGKLSSFIGLIIVTISILIMALGVLQGRDVLEMFITSVAVAVAAIPEGLAVAVTVILVLGMQQMFKRKALVRKLVAAETLGSTTVICTDKTGTLTEGKMTVTNIVIGENEYEVGEEGTRQHGQEAKIVSLALQIGMLCNDAVIENDNEQLADWRLVGAPTETALLLAAMQSGLNREKLLKIEPRFASQPFNSEAKFMITLHKQKNGSFKLYEKGAPERVIQKSSKFYHHGKLIVLKKNEKEKLMKTYEKLTSSGLRVIGVAMRDLQKAKAAKVINDEGKVDWSDIDKELVFVGFIALRDPLRPETKETIKICRAAGIRPVIITGDHRLTAKAVALEVGLKVKDENILTGDILDKTNDKKLEDLVKKIDIFARVSPHHKLRIVKALQANGEVVAMTGDGINDSPALKAADIGISLGTGTDIAKETADIVLLDDNFSTIVAAVKQGRVIFDNIRKVITYLVSDSFSVVILIIGSIALGMPLAIMPAQILWINIVNDGFPNFSLAFEEAEEGVMKRKPLRKTEAIVNGEMKMIIFAAGFIRDFFILGIFYIFSSYYELSYVRTVVFAAVGIGSLMCVFSLRDLRKPIWQKNLFSNRYLIGAIFASLSLLLLAIYWSPLQILLRTESLRAGSWLVVAGAGLLSIVLIELIKYIYNARKT